MVVVAAAARDVTNIAQAEQGALTVAGRCNIRNSTKTKRGWPTFSVVLSGRASAGENAVRAGTGIMLSVRAGTGVMLSVRAGTEDNAVSQSWYWDNAVSQRW